MITQVTNSNKELFMTVAPQFMLNLISSNNVVAWGDYTKDQNDKLVATGIIINTFFNNSPMVLWHFVDEAYQNQGIGELLLDQVMDGNKLVTLLFPTKYVSDSYFENISDYYYDFGFRLLDSVEFKNPDFYFVSQPVGNYPYLKDVSTQNVIPLSQVPSFALNAISSKLASRSPLGMFYNDLNESSNALSCAIYKDSTIVGLLLAEEADDYVTMLELINFDNSSPKNILSLLKFFMSEVSAKYPDGVHIQIPSTQTNNAQAKAFKFIFPGLIELVPHAMVLDRNI